MNEANLSEYNRGIVRRLRAGAFLRVYGASLRAPFIRLKSSDSDAGEVVPLSSFLALKNSRFLKEIPDTLTGVERYTISDHKLIP